MQRPALSCLVLVLLPLLAFAAQSANAPFEGQVVQVLDSQTLQEADCNSQSVSVRVGMTPPISV